MTNQLNATWIPLYWQPVMGSGERIMAGAIVDYCGEITAHRLIRDDVLNCLYGSSADNTRKLIDTAMEIQREIATHTGLGNLPEVMGIISGRPHTTAARSRFEALRHAVLLYSSLCSLDVLDDEDEDAPTLINDAGKRFVTEVREKTIFTNPELSICFNRPSPVVESGEPVKFGFISDKAIVHFVVLSPTRAAYSVREARAKLWELSGASEYSSIANAALIMGVPRDDDATIGTQQAAAAQRNRDEIEREADKRKMRLYHVSTASDGAEQLKKIAA